MPWSISSSRAAPLDVSLDAEQETFLALFRHRRKVGQDRRRLRSVLQVCRQQITLAEAQQKIASDWIAAYKHHFHTETPLRAHLGPSDDEDAELVLVPGEAIVTQVATFHLEDR